MTRYSVLFIAAACLAMMACKGKQATDEATTDTTTVDTVDSAPSQSDTVTVKNYNFKVEDKFAYVSLKASLPSSTDAASVAMRKSLLDNVEKAFAFDMEGTRIASVYKGNADDIEKYSKYYMNAHLKQLSADAKQTNEDLNTMDDIQQSSDEMEITKQFEMGSLVQFSIVNFIYSAGAAHPGIVAHSALFNKQTGKEVKQLLVKDAAKKMQKLLIKGLISYYKDNDEDVNEQTIWDYLQIGDDISSSPKFIPLPQDVPCPQKDGLCFTYGQYEIACYAAGMPSFVIPYDKVKPYLTDEAKQLLGL